MKYALPLSFHINIIFFFSHSTPATFSSLKHLLFNNNNISFHFLLSYWMGQTRKKPEQCVIVMEMPASNTWCHYIMGCLVLLSCRHFGLLYFFIYIQQIFTTIFRLEIIFPVLILGKFMYSLLLR